MSYTCDWTKVSGYACPQKGNFRFVQGLVRKKSRCEAPFGQAIHEGLRVLYACGNREESKAAFRRIYQDFEGADPIRTLSKGEELITAFDVWKREEPWVSLMGEQITKAPLGGGFEWVAILDQIGTYEGRPAVQEFKTTRWPGFFREEPNSQITGQIYNLQWLLGLEEPPVDVVTIIEINDKSVEGRIRTRYDDRPVIRRIITSRTQEQLERWKEDMRMLMNAVREWEGMENPPMRTENCSGYGGCPYLDLCKVGPGELREALIENEFVVQRWEPEKARG